MADCAVTEPRVAEVVERGRNSADVAAGIRARPNGDIGMTLKASEADFVTGEHARICGAVRFMATPAVIRANGCVLEGKRPAFVGVALEAAGLVSRDGLEGARTHGAVRIVAVDAEHGGFR